MELRRLIKHKKSFTDYTGLFFALAVIFAVAIFFIILSFSYNQIKPQMNAALANASTPESSSNVTKILDQAGSSILKFNPLFPLLLIGVFGFVLVVALFGQSHPAFLFIGLVVLGVALILAAVFSNVYGELTSTSALSSTESDFNIMSIFLQYLPIVIVILFVAIAIILYSKTGGAVGGIWKNDAKIFSK